MKTTNRSTRLAWTLALGSWTCGSLLAACGDGSSDPDNDGSGGLHSTTDGGDGNGDGDGDGDGDTGTGGNSSSGGGEGGDGGAGDDTSNEEGTGGTPTGGTGGTQNTPEIHVSTIEELTDQSSENYHDNEHGLITGGRLKQWIDDWEGTKPDAIEGRLIILQITGSTPFTHITPKEEDGVYSYLAASTLFNKPRDNGVSRFEQDIPAGADADALLKKYGLDPRKDLIVLTFEQQGDTQNSVVHSIGRAWVFFKYWGVQNEHIAILNGSVNWNANNHGVALSIVAGHEASVPPENGKVTVRDLEVDNTIVSVSLEEIIELLEERHEEGASYDDGVRIVDARGGAEAYGLKKATSTGRTNCASYTGTAPNAKCSTPFEGRIKGAQSVPWTQFVDNAANGFRFKPYADVKAIFDAQSGWDDAAGSTIQYCRTNQRSTVTGIVASVILGYPTRLYETSFIEWGHLSAGPPDEVLGGAGNVASYPNKQLVAENFPLRTDLDWLTEHAELHPNDVAAYTPGGTLGTLTQPVTWVDGPNYNDEADISPPIAGVWPLLNPTATTSRLSIDTDRAYLRNISIDELED
jgi:thiosulfate/3-mercaptopyruvate sulfurtransferase